MLQEIKLQCFPTNYISLKLLILYLHRSLVKSLYVKNKLSFGESYSGVIQVASTLYEAQANVFNLGLLIILNNLIRASKLGQLQRKLK